MGIIPQSVFWSVLWVCRFIQSITAFEFIFPLGRSMSQFHFCVLSFQERQQFEGWSILFALFPHLPFFPTGVDASA